jgi:hypothetical protein
METSVKEYRNKQDKLIKDSGAYFYYLRGENRHIFGGVCLKKVDNVWCRGISICSNRDKFDKDMAKKYARSRATTACYAKESNLPVNPEASEASYKLYRHYTQLFSSVPGKCQVAAYKSQYGAKLLDIEKRMVGE